MSRLLTAAEVEAKSAVNRAAHAPRTVSLGSSPKKIGRPPGKWKPKPPTEHQEQKALILWADFQLPLWGYDARLLFAIPNAGAGAQSGQAGKLKAEGVRAGMTDLMLAVVKSFHGLYIEMKRIGGDKPEAHQAEYHELLRAQGYAVHVCYGQQEAISKIKEYLGRE